MPPERIEMSETEFFALRDLIHEYAGLVFDDEKKYVMQRRLTPRLKATGARNFGEYAWHLRYGARGRRELEEAVDRVAVNESYFFREAYQLSAFADEILPEIRWDSQREKRLSIWSAGCSTGEEPYTISMLLLENGMFSDWDVRIIGSDISRKALSSASRARYRQSALRETDQIRQKRFFRKVDSGWELREDVKAPVAFARLNLLEHQPLGLVGEVDVLFCRNVLIYFDTEARERVLDSFYRHLAPGGYLLLGHSESLLSLSTAFELVQLQNDTVYRKPRSAVD